MLIAIIVLSVALLMVALCLAWLASACRDWRGRILYTEYSLNLMHYNEFANQFADKEPTPEESFTIAKMQQQLHDQARAIGLNFFPFERPQDVS